MKLAHGLIAAIVLLVSGCAAEPEPSIVHAHGDVLAVAAPPNRVACDARLRAETVAAQRIRGDLMSAHLGSDAAAVAAAAADPASTTEILGIPLTVIERNMVRASGVDLEGGAALTYWVRVGAPERFGGMWFDPRGANQRVVAVVDGDPDTIGLAQCLGQMDMRYVWADLSLTAGHALAKQIADDADELRLRGIEIHAISYQEDEGIMIVGVTQIPAGLEQELADRYGAPIRVEIQPLGEPLGRRGVACTCYVPRRVGSSPHPGGA